MAGLKQAEISETLAIPKGTVKSLMHRAVKSLQKELSAYRPEPIKERGKKCDVKTLSV
jgi:RNA polymerase sigma-70 factor (ECF subfamily)